MSVLGHSPVQVGHVPYLPPPLSVRIFGHFLPFSVFLARRAPCSAFPCTPVACTNGLYMVCCLCRLLPVTRIPHQSTDAYTRGELAPGEHGKFCHFGSCEPNSALHNAMAHEDLSEASKVWPPLDSHWVPHRTLTPIIKPP